MQGTIVLRHRPRLCMGAAIAGKKEGEGPLGSGFDQVIQDDLFSEESWEKAECRFFYTAADTCIRKAGLTHQQVDVMLGGDLLNQITSASMAARELKIPFLGLYGACSTMAESLLVAATLVDGGYADRAAAMTSSHFAAAERQYRQPLEYGGQRPPTAQWTVTGAGCVILGGEGSIRVGCATVGCVIDKGIRDANNMGSAMAPAAYETLRQHLADTGRSPEDYDLIATGDLGGIGRDLLLALADAAGIDLPPEKLIDCGASLYYQEQDTHAGGSGCGCVASVSCSWLMKRMEAGELNRLLLVGSGAMLSPTSSQQGQSVPGIAYAACIERSNV